MEKEIYKKTYTEENTPGWQAIDDALEKVYAEKEPKHYGPLCGIHYAAGGTDPIDGISIYESQKHMPHKHIVSYGMSELYYNEEAAGGEFSKWGFEFTFRLKPYKEDNGEPGWALHLMNNLARYVNNKERWFEENQFIPGNGPIRLNTDTEIIGLLCVLDPELGKINTVHGEVSFIQLVGITARELEELQKNPTTAAVEQLVNELKKDNPLLITDLERK
ncbi:MAG: suppressor of fused domain protein [Flavobacteriales bacterium]